MRDKNGQNGVAMDAITIRAARLEDAGPISRLDVETWQATYAGILATPYLAGLSPERRAIGWANVIRREPRDVRVALNTDGEVVGFGSCGTCRGEPGFTSEVFTLYVAPDWQNEGIGRRLLLAMFARLVSEGHASAVIWVLRENPSRFFYHRLGGKEVRRKLLPFNGTQVAASGYGWRDLPRFLSTAAGADRERGPQS
jgi:ribosomal protein S18 acetylase RimI-like enzyme